jgi:hypothetical protein
MAQNTINTMKNDMTRIITLTKITFDKEINNYKKKAIISEGIYTTIKRYLGTNMPVTLKALLQDISTNGSDEAPSDLSLYQQRGIYFNEQFAQEREEQGKLLAAAGVRDEIKLSNKTVNYLANVMTPMAINDGRVKVKFEGEAGSTRKLIITDIKFKEEEEDKLTDQIKNDINLILGESAKHISGTSQMKSLKSIASITPNIKVFDVGSEKGLSDIDIELSLLYHYGKEYKQGTFRTIHIQNKQTTKFKDKPYYAVLNKCNVMNLEQIAQGVVNSSFGTIDFFCLNGQVYYAYEVLDLIKKEVISFLLNNDIDGLRKFLGGK